MKWKVSLVAIVLLIFLTGCVAPPELGVITGRVNFPVISDTGYAGLGIAVVVLDGGEYTYTTPDGLFVFQDIPYGNHTLTIKEGYFTAKPVDVVVTKHGVSLDIPVEIDRVYVTSMEQYGNPGQFEWQVYLTQSGIDASAVRVALEGEGEQWEFTSGSEESNLFLMYIPLTDVVPDGSYTFQLTYLSAEGGVLGGVEKVISLPVLTQLPVSGIDSGYPTFSWKRVAPEQLVSYYVHVSALSPDGSMRPLYIYTTGDSYTLQSYLSQGQYQSIIKATIMDPITGTTLADLSSNAIRFEVSSPGGE